MDLVDAVSNLSGDTKASKPKNDYYTHQVITMILSLLYAVTFVLPFACISAELSERPCFIPLQWFNLVVNHREVRPNELRQSDVFPSLYRKTGVVVDAYKYKAPSGKNYGIGLFST